MSIRSTPGKVISVRGILGRSQSMLASWRDDRLGIDVPRRATNCRHQGDAFNAQSRFQAEISFSVAATTAAVKAVTVNVTQGAEGKEILARGAN